MTVLVDADEEYRLYKTFDTLRFPLIVLVVYIHNAGSEIAFSNGVVAVRSDFFIKTFAENFISQGIARVAVPLFFFISGYLFFFNAKWSLETYRRKLVARVHTLMIPFLFWTIFWLAFKAVLQISPITAAYFNGAKDSILGYDLFEVFDAIFGFTHDPSAYQFWFIRDLIVLVLISPLLHLLLGRVVIATLIVLGVCWFTKFWPIYVPGIEPLLFFSIGSSMAMRRLDPSWRTDRAFLLVTGALALACFACFAFSAFHFPLVQKVGILSGLTWMLCAARSALSNTFWVKWTIKLSSAAFFVFATHEPALTILRKLVFRFLHLGQWMSLLTYLLLPIIIVVGTTVAYFLLLRIAPDLTQVITGGRAAKAK